MKYWHICEEYETVATSLFLSFFPSRWLSWGRRIAARHSAMAAFIVDCFMSVEIRFLLNLSSFTQGHALPLYRHPPLVI